MEVRVSNKEGHNKVSSAFGVYYLRDMEPRIHKESLVGYSTTFDGLGVFMSTQGSQQANGKQIANSISIIMGDGKRVYNRPVNWNKACYRVYRHQPEGVYTKLRIKYEHGLVSVSSFDLGTN